MAKPNTVFQKVADWINDWKTPLWLKNLLQELNDILIVLLKQVSKEYIDYLKDEIIKASEMNISNEEKFKYVFGKAKDGFNQFKVTITDSTINALIEFLVLKLKNTNDI